MSAAIVGDTHQLEGFLDDLKAGQPERYYDYVHETYGRMFRSGSVQALETFRDLLRQVLAIGYEVWLSGAKVELRNGVANMPSEGVLQKPTDRR
jgi:hypothetical protein